MTSADALTWKPLTVDDVPALTALLNRIDEAEGLGEPAEEPSIREWLTMPGLDLAADSVAVREGERLIGAGLVDVAPAVDREGRARCGLAGGVDPARRRQGIGSRLLELMEARAAQLAAERHPAARAFFRIGGGRDRVGEGDERSGGADVRPVLDRRGYRRVRSWLEMVRELPGGPLTTPDPEGVVLISPDDAHREVTRRAHAAAFADHWGSTAPTPERWKVWWSSHTARPALSTIAVDAEGTVLAYLIAAEDKPQVLHVGLVGTRPEVRGRGLARAVIARSLRAAAESGYRSAQLEVDAESLTGATRLYEGLGFTRHQVFATYEKPVG